jgi:hypothetical protein
MGNCKINEYSHGGYTGYDHRNIGGSEDHQTEEDIDQENAWWRCAEICSEMGKDRCQGWTFAYNGDPSGKYKCYLKWDLTPQSSWWCDLNVISGLWESSSELSSESPGDPLCSALSPTDPVPCPDVKGRSGASISHDPEIQCVHNPECLKESLHGCFEETGCQYADVPQLRGDPLCTALSPTDPVPCPDVKGSSGASISHDPEIQCVYNPKCLKESLHGCFEETGCQYIYLSTPKENALLAHAARAADRRAGLAANSTGCGEVGVYMTGTEWTQVCQRMCPGSQSTPIGHGGNCWQCWCHGQGVQPPTALPDPGYEDLVSGAFPGCCASNTYPQSGKDPCGSWQLKEKGQC